ncbi:hypothetical protein D3C76_910070 [compost metagenome]
MYPLDLHIEHRLGVDVDAKALVYQLGQGLFVVQALLGETFAERRLFGQGLQADQALFRIIQNFFTQLFDQHVGQLGIGLVEPAAEGDAVGLVVDTPRVKLVQLGKYRAAHQGRVQVRHPVDAMGAEKRQVPHTYPAAVVFFDQGNGTQHVKIMDALRAQGVDVIGIDQVDNLHVPRQHALHQAYRPGFQGFGQQGVIGIGQRLDGDLPGAVPLNAVFIDQQTHQLGNGDRRVRVVELDSCLVGQVEQRVVHVAVAAKQILQRRGNEKILLAQAQLLPCFSAIGRV